MSRSLALRSLAARRAAAAGATPARAPRADGCTQRSPPLSTAAATARARGRPRHRPRRLRAQRRTRRSLPASNEKLAVTYAALAALGPAFRIETDVLGEGTPAGRDLARQPRPEGLRRPDARPRRPRRARARSVRAAGIRRVTGGAGRRTSRSSTRGAAGPAGSRRSTRGVAAALGAGRRPGVDRRRSAAAPRLFRKALARAPASASPAAARGRARAGGWPLAVRSTRRRSREILRYMDVESDNFTAELVLKQLGRRHGRAARPPPGPRRPRASSRARAARGRPDRRRLRALACSTA